jgi:hypothetical protein
MIERITMEEIKKELIEAGKKYPKNFVEKRGSIFLLDFIIARRKAFLRTDKLMYHSRLKVDVNKNEIIFFEILKESGAGVGAGGADEFGTGFGFKVEKTKIGSDGRREGVIKQQSDLFGKKYEYEFDYEKVRQDAESIARRSGFDFKYVLNERAVR